MTILAIEKAWILAARPKTLPISSVPILIATALAAKQVDRVDWVIVFCAFFTSLAIQIGTNLVNDALDFKKGADGDDRLGPKRMTQQGLLSYKNVMTGGLVSFSLAVLFGIPLVLEGGWILAIVLLLSILCGYLYTGGPYPLAYLGISDLFILIFFGWVSTCTVFFLLTGGVTFQCFLAATQIGLLAMVPHAINNLRDCHTDAKVNKRTLAVRFGISFARWEITFLSLLPFILGLFWLSDRLFLSTIFPLFALPQAIETLHAIWRISPSKRYNDFLAKSALCQLLFGYLLALSFFVK